LASNLNWILNFQFSNLNSIKKSIKKGLTSFADGDIIHFADAPDSTNI